MTEPLPITVTETDAAMDSAGNLIDTIPVKIVDADTVVMGGRLQDVIPVRVVGDGPSPTPVMPSIDGIARVGEILTGDDGNIFDTITSRAWLRSATAISGADGGTYLQVEDDEGEMIAYQVTGLVDGGVVVATSEAVGPVQSALPAPTLNTLTLGTATLTDQMEPGDVVALIIGRLDTDEIISGTGDAFDNDLLAVDNDIPAIVVGAEGPADTGTFGFVGTHPTAWNSPHPSGPFDSIEMEEVSEPAADFTVTNDSEFSDAHTAASSGQIIELAASGSFGDLTVTKSGLIVRGEDADAANVNRIHVNDAQDVTLRRLPIQWVGGSPTYPLLGASGNCDGLLVEDGTIRGGWGSAPKENFDTSWNAGAEPGKYPVGSPGNYGAVNGLSNNSSSDRIPVGIGQGSGTAWTGSHTIRNNRISDVLHGIRSIANGSNLEIDICGNDIRRCYGVHASISTGENFVSSVKLWIRGNYGEDAFAQKQDNQDPHREFWGTFANGADTTAMHGVMVAGNVAWSSDTNRGNGTACIALQDNDNNDPLIAPIVHRNWGATRMEGGIAVEAHLGGIISRNTALSNTQSNAVRSGDNEATGNSVSGAGIASVLTKALSTDYAIIAGLAGPTLVVDNIAEGVNFSFGTPIASGNVTTGKGEPGSEYTAYFGAPGGGWASIMADPEAAAAHMQGKTGNAVGAGKGALDEGQTLAQLMAAWASDTPPLEEIAAHVGWPNKTAQAISTTITSEWAPITKAYGLDLPVSITDGEIEIADDPSGTNSTGWTDDPDSTGPGHRWARRRIASSSSASTSVTCSTTIGDGAALEWEVETASAAAYNRVAFERTTPDIFRTGSTNFGLSDGQAVSFACIFSTPTIPGAVMPIFGDTGGQTMRIAVNASTGIMRVLLGTGPFADIRSNTLGGVVADGNIHVVLCSIDTSKTSIGTGVQLYIDGADLLSTSTGTWDTNGTSFIPWATNRQWYVGGNQSAGHASNFEGELDMLWVMPNVLVDLTDAGNRAKFLADLIGANGQGPTGSSPPIYLTGNAAAWNHTNGLNLGTGAKFIKVDSAAVTDV